MLRDLTSGYLFNFISYHSPTPLSLYACYSPYLCWLLSFSSWPITCLTIIKACICQDRLRYATVTKNLQISLAQITKGYLSFTIPCVSWFRRAALLSVVTPNWHCWLPSYRKRKRFLRVSQWQLNVRLRRNKCHIRSCFLSSHLPQSTIREPKCVILPCGQERRRSVIIQWTELVMTTVAYFSVCVAWIKTFWSVFQPSYYKIWQGQPGGARVECEWRMKTREEGWSSQLKLRQKWERTWLSLAAHWTSPTDACKKMWWPFVRSFRLRVPYANGGLERSPCPEITYLLLSATLPLEIYSFGSKMTFPRLYATEHFY